MRAHELEVVVYSDQYRGSGFVTVLPSEIPVGDLGDITGIYWAKLGKVTQEVVDAVLKSL